MKKSPEDRIRGALERRGWVPLSIKQHPANPDYWQIEFTSPDQRLMGGRHCHTLENVLRWIRRLGWIEGYQK